MCFDEGEARCSPDGTRVERCLNGAWQTTDDCHLINLVCKNADCVSPGDCLSGDLQCGPDGTHQWRCEGGGWKLHRYCSAGCSGNTCRTLFQALNPKLMSLALLALGVIILTQKKKKR